MTANSFASRNCTAWASSLTSDAWLNCRCTRARSPWRHTYSSVRYRMAVTDLRTCSVVNHSTAPMVRTMPIPNRLASLRRVEMFIAALLVNNCYCGRHDGEQPLEVNVVQIIRHGTLAGKLVLGRPPCLFFQRKQQALIQAYVKPVRRPEFF